MRYPSGFTLVEVLIALAIVGILATIVMPQYSRYQLRTKLTAAVAESSSLRQGVEECLSSGQQPSLNLVGSAATTSNCDMSIIGDAQSGATAITCLVRGFPKDATNVSIVWTRQGIGGWACAASGVSDTTLLPKSCGGS